jgi:hypothetical protein
MTNSNRNLLSSITIVLAVLLLLACSLRVASATSTVDTKDSVLPDFLERLLDSHSVGASASELKQTRTQWAEQLERNQDVIKATGGAVLDFSPLDSQATSYLASVEYTSPYESYGYIENAECMLGDYMDTNYAHLHTDGWNQNPSNPMGGEAFASGYMSEYAGGNVYVYAKAGPHTGSDPPWKNIVMVFASNDINTDFLQWDLIGYASVRNNVPAYVYIGTAEQYYACFAIACWTPAPYPDPYTYPDYFNCVQIDMVYATASADCRLSISSGAGGTTNPSPDYYWNDLGTPVSVTAVEYTNYDFDHWTLDGEYYTRKIQLMSQ